MLDKNRIAYYCVGKRIVGYVESWRVNYYQLGKIICGETFDPEYEMVNQGHILYIANVWIDEDYKGQKILSILKEAVFRHNIQCEYIVGEKINKKSQPVKVWKMQDWWNKLGVKNG